VAGRALLPPASRRFLFDMVSDCAEYRFSRLSAIRGEANFSGSGKRDVGSNGLSKRLSTPQGLNGKGRLTPKACLNRSPRARAEHVLPVPS
jgi:hypothetical protein